MSHLILCVASLLIAQVQSGSTIRVYPDQVNLDTPFSAQRVLVVREVAGAAIEDITSRCSLIFESPAIAKAEAGNILRPLADGTTNLIVKLEKDSYSKTIPVRVSSMAEAAPSFLRHVQPVLTKLGCNSGSCHGALAGKGGLRLSLRGYNPAADHHAIVQDLLGRRSDVLQPQRSLMIRKPLNQVAHGGGKKMRENSLEHDILSKWIAAGGPFTEFGNNHQKREKPEQLELLPAVMKPKSGSKIQVLVQSRYADGSMEDSSHWAKFNSTDEAVAGVDEDGNVLGIGAGEGHLTAWHSDRVAVARVGRPFNLERKTAWPQFNPQNRIDELISAKWTELGLEPSTRVGDEAFLRRLWIDLLGTLPTPEEQLEFLADTNLNKRQDWVNKALKSYLYVDYWTHRYEDLFLVRTGRLQQSAVWSFHQELRQAVSDNNPWDKVVHRMIAGKGSNLKDGLLNLHVLHRDPATLAEAVAVTFLGQPIGCAKCHNHPQDQWTQNQYWAFANLFGRTALKPGNTSGEIVVVSMKVGDAPHLRTGIPMPPAPLGAVGIPLDSPLDRREHLANWMTSPANSYFAKTHVNRIWRLLMGRGLVEPDDDMRATNPPTHPELLSHLADSWIRGGFDNRELIRSIVLSDTYQRASLPNQSNPDDLKFFTRYQPRRLEAEVLLDAYAQVLAAPTLFTDVTPGGGNGSSPYGGYPKGTRAIQLPDTAVVSQFLDTFGRPERLQACSCERLNDPNVSQALQISNGPTLNNKLVAKENILEKMASKGESPKKMLNELFRRALSREPSPTESAKFLPLLEESVPAKLRQALEDIAWAILSSTEFMVNR